MNDVMEQSVMALRLALTEVTDAIALSLLSLSTLCNASASDLADQVDEAICKFLLLVPDRTTAKTLLEALGSLGATGTFGQLPYLQFTVMLRCAVEGHAPMRGSSKWHRVVHDQLLRRYALPSAILRWDMERDELVRRYPRLLRAMRDAAILTRTEAEAALLQLLRTYPSQRAQSLPASEAVSHFGGNLKVVRVAIRRRRMFPSTARAFVPA